MGSLTDLVDPFEWFHDSASTKAADATKKAASTAAGYQTEALNYLKEANAVPQAYKEDALQKLGAIYGLPGLSAVPGLSTDGTTTTTDNPYADYGQQDFITEVMNTPLYQSLMSGKEMGEETIMRNAGATGGLRSGNVQANMYDYDTQLANQSLLQAYNSQLSGLTGLAGLSTNENAIASTTSDIGTTLAQGISGAAQAYQIGNQNSFNNLMGVGNLALTAAMFSDRRLKKNIKEIGSVNGYKWYSFTWNKIAEALGLKGNTAGCMADEVYKLTPEAVSIKDGFLFVDYSKIKFC